MKRKKKEFPKRWGSTTQTTKIQVLGKTGYYCLAGAKSFITFRLPFWQTTTASFSYYGTDQSPEVPPQKMSCPEKSSSHTLKKNSFYFSYANKVKFYWENAPTEFSYIGVVMLVLSVQEHKTWEVCHCITDEGSQVGLVLNLANSTLSNTL